MNARTEAGWPPPRTGGEHAIREWLDALSTGRCSPGAFLWEMRERFNGDQDRNWEGLSLLDEYYRRGKIKAEVFEAVKSRLQGAPHDPTEDSVPTLRSQTSKIVTAPAAAQRRPTTAGFKKARRPAREVTVGDVLRDRYRIEEVLGHGGMGTVFAATDDYRLDLPSTGQRIAIKVLHTAVTVRDELLAELQREFQHLQLLSHPNIVRVHEFDRDGDVAFFTMELLTGALLSRVLAARNGIALQKHYALAIIRGVGEALSHAHSRGVVHGDINPQNIFITNDGEIRVLDFGASHRMPQTADVPASGLTPLVTPGYASCQLLDGQIPDSRDDLFALACVSYLLLSGQHPFPNLSAAEARDQRVRIRRPPNLTSSQWAALRNGLRWDREQRPIDVLQWIDSVDPDAAVYRLPAVNALARTPPPRRRRRARLAALAVAMAGLLVAGGYWAYTNDESLAEHAAQWSAEGQSAGTRAAAVVSGWFNGGPRTRPGVPETSASPALGTPASDTSPAMATATARPAVAAPIAVRPQIAAVERKATVPAPGVPSSDSRATSVLTGGPSRIEMAADTVDVPRADTSAQVTVRRRGSTRGEAVFTWWTESGTAKPGIDFAPVTPHLEHMADGSSSLNLNVNVSDQPRSQAKSFYVVIERAEAGPALGARTLTLVTIQPSE